jgi:hypothetical protein
MSEPRKPERRSGLEQGFHEALSGERGALEETHRRRYLGAEQFLPFAAAAEEPSEEPAPKGSGEYRLIFGAPSRPRRD